MILNSMIVTGFIAMSLSSVVVQADVSNDVSYNEGKWQQWDAPGALVTALLDSQGLFPEMVIQGDPIAVDEVDEHASHCQMKVFRPDLLVPAMPHPDNTFTCLVKAEGKQAVLTLPIQSIAFKGWGNAADEAYAERNGLPKRFQIKNQDFARNLTKALGKQLQKGHEQFDGWYICGPGGVQCNSAVSLDYPLGTSAYLVCAIDTDAGEEFMNHCTFFYPAEWARD